MSMTPGRSAQVPATDEKRTSEARAVPVTVGRLRQLLEAFHDATEVWISEDNLLHRVVVDAKDTAAGYGVVLKRGDRVTW